MIAMSIAVTGCTKKIDAPSANADATTPASAPAAAPENPMVGGAAMYATKNVVESAVNSKDQSTLVAAAKAAGLVATLSGLGPFTVFAPTSAAFDKLPAGTVVTLVKPANKATLTKILIYHVVAGRMTAADLAAKIKAGGGRRRPRVAVQGCRPGSPRRATPDDCKSPATPKPRLNR
jgi:uncharacterized surface protein with fasciclin (FAS1) repeats